MRRRVWVSGDYGDEPTCVSYSIEEAMLQAEKMHRVDIDEEGLSAQWTCVFVDGEPDQLRCTTTFTTQSGKEVRLYVESMNLETDGEPRA